LTSQNLSKILATLPGLSKPDLSAVRAAADGLLGPQGGSPVSANEGAATPLFDAMTRALGLRLGFGPFQATATYKAYKRGASAVALFLTEAALGASKDRITENAFLSLLIDCLIDDLKERNVPLSMGTLCNNLERAPQVFRAAFPGYIENGHSGVILKAMTGKL
jgi:hypothetical protein